MTLKQIILSFLIVLLVCSSIQAQNQYKKLIDDILKTESYQTWQGKVDTLKSLGDTAIILIADYLIDEKLSHTAYRTLLSIDPIKTAPYIFDAMPNVEKNLPRLVFNFYNMRVLVGDIESSELKSKMLNKAIHYLEEKSTGILASYAIQTVGLCGSEADMSLLEAIYKNYQSYHSNEYWNTKIKNTCEAALARLGNEEYLTKIENELKEKLPKSIDTQELSLLVAKIWKAGFSMDKRYLPLLCSIINSNSVFKHDLSSDIVYPSFKDEAVKSMSLILGMEYNMMTSKEAIAHYCK